MADPTSPSDGTQPNELPPGVGSNVSLFGNASMRSMASGGVTHTSDSPLPLQVPDPAIMSTWWNAPQPLQPPRSPPVDPGGPVGPPFPPPTTPVVVDFGGGIEITTAVDTAVGLGAAQGAGTSIAEAVGGTAHRIDVPEGRIKINGEAPDIAHFVGHVASRRTVIIRTVMNNQVAAQLSALSFVVELELRLDTLRASGSNSEIATLDDLKRRVEEFLAANEKAEETAIADATLSVADGLGRYWTEKHKTICDVGLFGVGLSFCAAAGALGVSETNILAVTALAGGNRVFDVVKAAADLVWGKGNKS
jgi:hypothetical protein